MSEQLCKYSSQYKPADKSYLVNFGSKNLRAIRISLPEPPPVHLIDGWGLHPNDQKFRRLEIPRKLKSLEEKVFQKYMNANRGVNGNNILRDFWSELRLREEYYKDEIRFIKRFIWFMHYGYWVFIHGKPVYLPGWYFSYLNLHKMSSDAGYIYPEYREKGRLRFLFRDYIHHTTETFADFDPETGEAIKVADANGRLSYRMVDTGSKTFLGTIEPKDRRGGLTNEYCHIITRIATSQRGADKLCTIVSMGGDNAETHFRKKLIPAWNSWPLWVRPVWVGGFGKLKTLEFTSNGLCDVETLDTSINYTESGDDLANDGKMIIGAGYDEQGKGKRTGNVQNRWQINKETMSLGGGSKLIGYCMHPSTVEKMEEGGKDYQDMCNLSNFYIRKKDGQTMSALAVTFFPSSFCMEGFIDPWGAPVYEQPTEDQKTNGYKRRIGSKVFIRNKRRDLYDPDDPAKMEEFRSFVRKFPEDYDECWTGVAGQLGFDNEKIRKQMKQLLINPQTVRGEFVWTDRTHMLVDFVEKRDGKWVITLDRPKPNERCRVTSMLDYSAFAGEEIMVNRPVDPTKYIIGLDPQRFSNKAEAQYLKNKHSKKSDTSIVVKRRRDKILDSGDKPQNWTTPHYVAAMRARLATSKEAADEAIKAAIYFNALIHVETNETNVWERLIEMRFGGYLNYMVETPAGGEMKRAAKPGTALATTSKKNGFTLMADYFNYHSHIEPIYELLEEADSISSMEQLHAYDMLAAAMHARIGETSPYADLMQYAFSEDETVEYLGASKIYL